MRTPYVQLPFSSCTFIFEIKHTNIWTWNWFHRMQSIGTQVYRHFARRRLWRTKCPMDASQLEKHGIWEKKCSSVSWRPVNWLTHRSKTDIWRFTNFIIIGTKLIKMFVIFCYIKRQYVFFCIQSIAKQMYVPYGFVHGIKSLPGTVLDLQIENHWTFWR